MNHANLTKLAELMETRPEIDMSYFDHEDDRDPHNCNSPSCVLGWAATIFPIPDDCDSYWDLSEPLFDIRSSGFTWDFLFGPCWPNDPIEAAGRIRYLLAGNPPEQYHPESPSYKRYAHAD